MHEFSIELAGNHHTNFQICMEKRWPKFENVSKKLPTSRTLELLAFDKKSTFDVALFP